MAGSMEQGESKREKGLRASSFYEKARRTAKVVKPHEIPWEDCGQGRKRDLVKAVQPVFHNLDASIHVLPPAGSSDPHRHMAEELVYVLEGQGYDLHWEEAAPQGEGHAQRQPQPARYDWQQGDTIYIPVNVLHQHFNLDVERPARFISATSRVADCATLDQMEQSPGATAGEQSYKGQND
ncbi:MAG: cupin domain-containing protein [Dehalococcoidia bacterium]|nr:cupin domain-containing protein [Dehalococcoidia bacterium]